MIINAFVRQQTLTLPRKSWVAGSRDYVGLHAIYQTADWAGLSVTAFFGNEADPKNLYTVNVVDGEIPPDKHLNLSAGKWKIWLVGLDLDGTQKISTQAETITVDPTGCSCDDFPEVPPSYAEDFERRLSRLERDGVGPGGGGGGPSDAVRYGPQELTEDEQRQARENIGAGAVADISAQVQQATSAAGAAQQSQRAAATSASNASQYASTAAGSAAGAGTSAQEAAASAESAAGSASAAAGSAQSASGSASAASGSADTANAAAGRAESAESGANSAAETARGHADSAGRSAQAATEQAIAAAGSAATATSEADRATREADRAEQAGSKPTKLAALTFTGAANAIYDGTKPVSVNIPEGSSGSDISLGVTGATVGQIVEIEEVDENGKPKRWKAVDKPSGGGGENSEVVANVTVAENVTQYDMPMTGFFQKYNDAAEICFKIYMPKPESGGGEAFGELSLRIMEGGGAWASCVVFDKLKVVPTQALGHVGYTIVFCWMKKEKTAPGTSIWPVLITEAAYKKNDGKQDYAQRAALMSAASAGSIARLTVQNGILPAKSIVQVIVRGEAK